MNMYELTTDFDRYLNAETDEELASALADITAGQIEVKAESYCNFLANVEGEIEKFKAEEKRLSNIRKAMENKVSRAKEYMKQALLAGNIQKLDAGTFKITISPSQGKLVIVNPQDIPSQFVDVVTSYQPRNDEIKAEIKAGNPVNGAYIEEGYRMTIR